MKKQKFDRLVLGAPTVDITNLKTNTAKPDDNTEHLKEKIRASCLNMMSIAENALDDNVELKNVTIMNHAPRFDADDVDPLGLKHHLAIFANSHFLELWLSSPYKDKICIGTHSLETSAEIRKIRHTDKRSGRYDGVHFYGTDGRNAYMESVLNILLSSFHTQFPAENVRARQSSVDDSHTRCPQTNYMNSKKYNNKRNYSSVVSGSQPLKTKNRFSVLGENSKNL